VILTLQVPFIDRSVNSGRIAKWHKAEGDWVDYGDDLFDFQIEEIAWLNRIVEARNLLSGFRDRGAAPNRSTRPWTVKFAVRVVALDTGFLRKAEVAEGQDVQVGDIIALLTTNEHEPLGGDGPATGSGTAFRVAHSVIDPADTEG
jgi:pyruvate/2-oxoglutarate dehydrogenase complex dihydrolipoamide acyltransferase (E2) component